MGLSGHNYVILRTSKAMCPLNMEILDLLRNAFLDRAVVELDYKFDEISTVSV